MKFNWKEAIKKLGRSADRNWVLISTIIYISISFILNKAKWRSATLLISFANLLHRFDRPISSLTSIICDGGQFVYLSSKTARILGIMHLIEASRSLPITSRARIDDLFAHMKIGWQPIDRSARKIYHEKFPRAVCFRASCGN